MASRDVVVVVKRDAMPVTKDSLDILLIGTTGEYPVDVYRDVAGVEAVYGDNGPCPNSKIVRKATTLFNQGKTTLAESLVNKFKIVSFDPPSASPATPARFIATFDELEEEIPADFNLFVRIGGNDNAVIEATTTTNITTSEELAQLFNNTSFVYDDVTYIAVVDGTTVTYTAAEGGKVDTIPARIDVYRDRGLTTKFGTNIPVATFKNGTNAITPAEAFVNQIKKFQDIDNDWYFLMTDKDDEDYVKAVAKFAELSEPTEAELGAGVEDHRKVYMGQTTNKKFAYNAARAAVIYTDKENIKEEPDASYTGNVAPFYPTSVTWKFKKPQNGNSTDGTMITVPALTDAQRDELLDNNVNFATYEYKYSYVKNGTCLNGEFIDVVLGGDWIAKRMRELLYNILLTNASVTYDDAGFGLIATAVMQALSEATDLNIIQRDAETNAGVYSIDVPSYADSTEEQRRNRVMPDIKWEALLAGAVHSVKTKGVLKASL